MNDSVSRRSFLKTSATTAVGAGAALGASGPALAAPMLAGDMGKPAELPKAKGQRVIVVGGGWSGLTIAKYLKRRNAALDVVLIERKWVFMSCPMANLWMTGSDAVNLEFLTHSYLDAAKNNDYLFFNATVVDVDRGKRRVYTEQGYLDYDFLVLSPGIDYNYAAIGVKDPGDVAHLKTYWPAGFQPGSEHVSLKGKLEDFDGGTFLLTVPAGNYRCLPAPYERACLIADYFKREKIKGKVLLLDANPNITIKAQGFQAAFDELYKDYIQRVESVEINKVDIGKKQVSSEFETFDFDDAAIYPRVRGAKLLETLGIVKPNSQMEANIDPFHYNVIGDDRVFVAGDSRPMPYSKSGNTSNSEGHFVAKVVAARAAGKGTLPWESPHTICYSAVSGDPLEAISVDAYYAYNSAGKSFAFDKVKLDEQRDRQKGQRDLEWAKGLYRDLFT